MPGPKPHSDPQGPHEVEREQTGQPETAPPGTPATGFPEPPGRDPGDVSREDSPRAPLDEPAG